MKKVLTVLMVVLIAVSAFAAWEVKADFGPEFMHFNAGEESGTKYAGIAIDVAGKYYVYDGIRVGAKAELWFIGGNAVHTPDDSKPKMLSLLATAGYGYDFGNFTLGADLGLGLSRMYQGGEGTNLFAIDAELEGSYDVTDMVAVNFGVDALFPFLEGENMFQAFKPFAGVTVKF